MLLHDLNSSSLKLPELNSAISICLYDWNLNSILVEIVENFSKIVENFSKNPRV